MASVILTHTPTFLPKSGPELLIYTQEETWLPEGARLLETTEGAGKEVSSPRWL